MSENERAFRSTRSKRPTIGLVIDNVFSVGAYQGTLWRGVHDVTEAQNVNLVCFSGGTLGTSPNNAFEGQRNVVYDMITPENTDGLIFTSGTLGNFVATDVFTDFFIQHAIVPSVSIGVAIKGFPAVLVDNEQGLRDAIAHLVEVHGYRRIAFICGPESNEDAERRYHTYAEVLGAYGISLDPTLVTPGTFLTPAGTEAIRILLDERGVDFEAIVAANDNMAVGAMTGLQERGIVVPYATAVVGFDDLQFVKNATPPLTTVRQPIREQGRKAAETLLAMLAGEKVPDILTLPTELVVRQSCGCMQQVEPPHITLDVKLPATTGAAPEAGLLARRAIVLSDMAKTLSGSMANSQDIVRWSTQLLDAFSADLGNPESGRFIRKLDEILRQVATLDEDMNLWHGATSVLRHHALSSLKDPAAMARAADLSEQAWTMVGSMGRRLLAQQDQALDAWNQTLRDVSQLLVTAFDADTLAEIGAQYMPRLGITECYASVFENPQAPTERARLVIAYNENGLIKLDEEAKSFPARQLAPAGLIEWAKERSQHWLLDSLYFRHDRLGLILFKVGELEGLAYETLRAQISSALKGALLVQQLEERSRTLQRRAVQLEASADVAQTITSIFDADELLKQTVNLIRDRFGFYHVGIFLIDESGEWAVLREATGEAGAQMKAEDHRLFVNESSMVGWTALNRQPRIALDAESEVGRFSHPLLPNTRSEVTLPVMVGEQILGVLNVQSEEEAAFDQDDVQVLQAMANQIAVAIENARRISDEATLLEATSPIYRASRLLTTATATREVADAIIESVAETGADGCLVVEFEFSLTDEPTALLYLGVWRRDREPQFQPGLRLPIEESPFPLEMISTLWTVTDVEQDRRLPESARAVFKATDAKALVNIPLRSGDRIIGQIVVLRSSPGPFPEAALRLYEVLSDQAAVALERAQLLEDAQKRAEQEHVTRQMIDRIRRADEVRQALEITAEDLAQTLKVPHVSIRLSPEVLGQD